MSVSVQARRGDKVDLEMQLRMLRVANKCGTSGIVEQMEGNNHQAGFVEREFLGLSWNYKVGKPCRDCQLLKLNMEAWTRHERPA